LGLLLLLLFFEDLVVEGVVGGQLVLVLLDGFGLFADLRDVLVYVYLERDTVVLVQVGGVLAGPPQEQVSQEHFKWIILGRGIIYRQREVDNIRLA
jgi:hypothetical protein